MHVMPGKKVDELFIRIDILSGDAVARTVAPQQDTISIFFLLVMKKH